MRLSFTTMATPGWTAERIADSATALGFSGVDIRCSDHLGETSPASTDDELALVRATFTMRGLAIPSLLCYNRQGYATGIDADAVAEDLADHARLATKLGCGSIRMFAGRPADGEIWASYLRVLADVIRTALARVSETNIVVQNHRGSISAEQSCLLAECVGSQRFRIVYSPDHALMMGEDAAGIVAQVSPHTRQLYIADVRPGGDRGFVGCLPGDGVVSLAAVLDEFTNRELPEWCSFKWEKIWQPALPDADVALPQFRAFMSRWV